MPEGAYLKDELGPVLAKGLAAVVTARPDDPIEYLALWLLHYLQKKELRAKEIDATRLLEKEREEWAKGRALREKAATTVIQREWKAHVRARQEAELKKAKLRQLFASIEETADEYAAEEPPTEGEKGEKERQVEGDKLAASAQFRRAKLFVQVLDKSTVGDFKFINQNNKSAIMVMRCCFYLLGMRPKQVDSWEKIRLLIKPYPFSQWLNSFNPVGTPLPKKRSMARVRRLLTTVSDEEIKAEGPALHAVYQWILGAATFREARDEYVRFMRASGRETEGEDYEDEEEIEGEEKDPDEEVIKAAELEALRRAEAEAAEENEMAEREPEE